MVSEAAFGALVAAIALQRLTELGRSRRNEARIRALGGCEHAPGHFAAMRALHAAWLVSMLLEVAVLRRPFLPVLAGPAAVVFLAGQVLRYSAISALGERWTVRIFTLPGRPRVRHGIYRWLRHPNYVGVILEIAAVPLLHGAFLTSLAFTLANAVVLAVRVPAEEAALRASDGPRAPSAAGRLATRASSGCP